MDCALSRVKPRRVVSWIYLSDFLANAAQGATSSCTGGGPPSTPHFSLQLLTCSPWSLPPPKGHCPESILLPFLSYVQSITHIGDHPFGHRLQGFPWALLREFGPKTSQSTFHARAALDEKLQKDQPHVAVAQKRGTKKVPAWSQNLLSPAVYFLSQIGGKGGWLSRPMKNHQRNPTPNTRDEKTQEWNSNWSLCRHKAM